MITAIATILGFLSSTLPSVIGYFNQKQANAYALQLRQLDMQAAREHTQGELAIADAQAATEQQRAVYSFDNSPSGVRWVDALRSFVRPYITLVLFHLWIAVECVITWYGIQRGLDLKELAGLIWSQETQALFAAVISFWFGQRAIKYGQALTSALPASAPSQAPTQAARAAAPRPQQPAPQHDHQAPV